jgi:hypothetical protein
LVLDEPDVTNFVPIEKSFFGKKSVRRMRIAAPVCLSLISAHAWQAVQPCGHLAAHYYSYMDEIWLYYKTLGEEAERKHNYELAEAMWAMAVLVSQTGGEKSPRLAFSLDRLGNALLKQQKLKLAELFLSRSWNIKAKLMSAPEVEKAVTLNLCAELRFKQGRHADAEHLCKAVHEIYVARLGTDHPNSIAAANNLTTVQRLSISHPRPAPAAGLSSLGPSVPPPIPAHHTPSSMPAVNASGQSSSGSVPVVPEPARHTPSSMPAVNASGQSSSGSVPVVPEPARHTPSSMPAVNASGQSSSGSVPVVPEPARHTPPSTPAVPTPASHVRALIRAQQSASQQMVPAPSTAASDALTFNRAEQSASQQMLPASSNPPPPDGVLQTPDGPTPMKISPAPVFIAPTAPSHSFPLKEAAPAASHSFPLKDTSSSPSAPPAADSGAPVRAADALRKAGNAREKCPRCGYELAGAECLRCTGTGMKPLSPFDKLT